MVHINSVIMSAKNKKVIFLAHENHTLKLWMERDQKLRIRMNSVGFVQSGYGTNVTQFHAEVLQELLSNLLLTAPWRTIL